jgi:hypothetical protein
MAAEVQTAQTGPDLASDDGGGRGRAARQARLGQLAEFSHEHLDDLRGIWDLKLP